MKSILRGTAFTMLFASALFMNLKIVAAPIPSSQEPAADNTKINKNDRTKGKLTADQQGQNRADRDTTKNIRRAIMKDKSLSMYAHNVKVITRDGMVTLRGPVRSNAEKQALVTKAKEVAGDNKVTDELKIKITRKKKS